AVGYDAQRHHDFVGRDFVFTAFEQFVAQCGDHGGMFLVEGEAGVGKSALLTNWMKRGAPHPGYFYRYSEGRTLPGDMPRALIEQIAKRYEIDPALPDNEQQYAERLRDLLAEVSRSRLTKDERLLICVDGLDEASHPEQAVQMLPKPPYPRGVFLIVASRPTAGGKDHLVTLTSAGAQRFRLSGMDTNNLEDATKFVQSKLPVSADDARRMAESAGGTFQLLRYWVESMAAGEMTVREAIERPADWSKLRSADRLIAWYRESWERITQKLSSDDEYERLVQFACLLAAARGPLSEKEGIELLGWTGARFDAARKHLAWLIARSVETESGFPDAYLRLRHQSVNDWMVSVEFEGPARHDLPRMQEQIGKHYCELAAKQTWSRVAPYGRRFAVRHLLLAKTPETLVKAAECLTDPRYLAATLGEVAEG
ncbi:MAG: ATP-binding protein, partial [Planctomycetes bacterium]|nr:ATP-binding protein [Planctomycetota bacterium]